MNSEELKHYGIKGQKWGVRRFQNEDGSLTAKGKERYGTEDNFKEQYPKDVKKTLDKTKSGIGKANDAVKKVREVNDKKVKKEREEKVKQDVSKMSDQELQKIVNRLNMEERYKQVMNSREAENGKDKVGKILEYAGTALVVGMSALELAMKIQEMRKK